MKRLIIAGAIASILTGCSSMNTKKVESQPIPSPTPAVTKDQTVAAQGKIDAPQTIDLPAWYIKAPASTDDYVFIAGTGYSNDLAMSREKALLDAQMKLADKINGMMNAVIKQHKTDSDGTVGVDKTSITIKKVIMDTALTGYHIEDSKIQTENRSYRTFMLLRYPIGDANRLLKVRQQREDQLRDSDDVAQKDLEKELDNLRKPKSQPAPAKAETEPVSLAPVVAPVIETRTVQASSVTAPATLSMTEVAAIEKQYGLQEVSDPALRQRRALAMLKPGAFVERMTVQ
jgi:uncharacterized protein YceK